MRVLVLILLMVAMYFWSGCSQSKDPPCSRSQVRQCPYPASQPSESDKWSKEIF